MPNPFPSLKFGGRALDEHFRDKRQNEALLQFLSTLESDGQEILQQRLANPEDSLESLPNQNQLQQLNEMQRVVKARRLAAENEVPQNSEVLQELSKMLQEQHRGRLSPNSPEAQERLYDLKTNLEGTKFGYNSSLVDKRQGAAADLERERHRNRVALEKMRAANKREVDRSVKLAEFVEGKFDPKRLDTGKVPALRQFAKEQIENLPPPNPDAEIYQGRMGREEYLDDVREWRDAVSKWRDLASFASMAELMQQQADPAAQQQADPAQNPKTEADFQMQMQQLQEEEAELDSLLNLEGL